MPASYHVKLVNPQQFTAASAEYAHLPGVDAVQDWRGRLKGFFRFLHGFQLAAYILAGVQGLATLVLLYNTIRMSAYSRRRETSIMRLVGATRIHIQLPFILESALAGLAGGLLAGATIFGLRIALIDHRFSHQQFTPVLSHSDVWAVIGYVILAGVGASALMAFIALRRHVRAAEPKRPSRQQRLSGAAGVPAPRTSPEPVSSSPADSDSGPPVAPAGGTPASPVSPVNLVGAQGDRPQGHRAKPAGTPRLFDS